MIYHNEIERFPAQWLRNLADSGHIDGPAHVDERSIVDVQPEDLADYTQCHFFAGIGGWSYALKIAGWPSDRPVWTGSCPCQPFSVAGKQRGEDDERHLWPAFARLIGECQPPIVFGEQVASADGRDWLAGVFTDLERMGYAVAGADLCAAGVGAPHIRQRLYWGAVRIEGLDDAAGARRIGPVEGTEGIARNKARVRLSGERCSASRLGNSSVSRLPHAESPIICNERRRQERRAIAESSAGRDSRLADADSPGRSEGSKATASTGYGRPAGAEGWSGAYWHECLDGKARRIPAEPAFFPLAHGVPGRVGRLRAYGNAIVPQVAAQFVTAFMEAAQ